MFFSIGNFIIGITDLCLRLFFFHFTKIAISSSRFTLKRKFSYAIKKTHSNYFLYNTFFFILFQNKFFLVYSANFSTSGNKIYSGLPILANSSWFIPAKCDIIWNFSRLYQLFFFFTHTRRRIYCVACIVCGISYARISWERSNFGRGFKIEWTMSQMVF